MPSCSTDFLEVFSGRLGFAHHETRRDHLDVWVLTWTSRPPVAVRYLCVKVLTNFWSAVSRTARASPFGRDTARTLPQQRGPNSPSTFISSRSIPRSGTKLPGSLKRFSNLAKRHRAGRIVEDTMALPAHTVHRQTVSAVEWVDCGSPVRDCTVCRRRQLTVSRRRCCRVVNVR